MLLTFTPESIEKIRQERKWTTVRRNPDRWLQWFRNAIIPLLQVYRGNPRNGGTRVAEVVCQSVTPARGDQFTRWLAESDGFYGEDSVGELKRTLARLHGIEEHLVDYVEWAIVAFDPKPIVEAPPAKEIP